MAKQKIVQSHGAMGQWSKNKKKKKNRTEQWQKMRKRAKYNSAKRKMAAASFLYNDQQNRVCDGYQNALYLNGQAKAFI